MDLNYLDNMVKDTTEAMNTAKGGVSFAIIWTIVVFVVAILCSILIYFLFIKSKTQFKGTTKTIRDYLNCDLIHIESIAKMAYYAGTIFVILNSVSVLVSHCTAKDVGGGLLEFFVWLFLWPIAVRFAFEIVMMFVRIWKNTENLKK